MLKSHHCILFSTKSQDNDPERTFDECVVLCVHHKTRPLVPPASVGVLLLCAHRIQVTAPRRFLLLLLLLLLGNAGAQELVFAVVSKKQPSHCKSQGKAPHGPTKAKTTTHHEHLTNVLCCPCTTKAANNTGIPQNPTRAKTTTQNKHLRNVLCCACRSTRQAGHRKCGAEQPFFSFCYTNILVSQKHDKT